MGLPKEETDQAVSADTRLPRLDRALTDRERIVTKAYRDVLGRDPDPSGLQEYAKYNRYDVIAADLALSDEGRRRGASSADYGDRGVDESRLSGSQQQFLSAYRQDSGYRGPLTEAVLRQIRNYQDAGDINFMRANLRGEIQHHAEIGRGGRIQAYSIVSPEALVTMGGRYTGIGNDAGDIVLLPRGTRFDEKDEWDRVQVLDNGLEVWGAKGHQTDGLLGELGIDPDSLPDWVAPTLDLFTANTGSSILGGGELHEDSSKFYADTFGRDFEKWLNTGYQVGAAVVGGVVGSVVPGVGTYAGASYGAAGMRALQGAAAHSVNPDVDLTDAIVDAALIAAAPHVGPPAAAAATTVTAKTRGDSWGKALQAGGEQLATNAALSLLPPGMRPYGSLAVSAGRAAISDDPGAWDNVVASALQTGLMLATSRGTPQDIKFEDRLRGLGTQLDPTNFENWFPTLREEDQVYLEQQGPEGNFEPRIRNRWAWQPRGREIGPNDRDQYPVAYGKDGRPLRHFYGVSGEPRNILLRADDEGVLQRWDTGERVGRFRDDGLVEEDQGYQPWAAREMQRRGMTGARR